MKHQLVPCPTGKRLLTLYVWHPCTQTVRHGGSWIIASHLSRRYQPQRPSNVCPALTAGLRSGHWLGWGRRLTLHECARLQGYLPSKLHWLQLASNNHHTLGNTMSVPVLHRVLIPSFESIGYRCNDPWLGSDASQCLVHRAQSETFTLNDFTKQRRLPFRRLKRPAPPTASSRGTAGAPARALHHYFSALANPCPVPRLPEITVSARAWARVHQPHSSSTSCIVRLL